MINIKTDNEIKIMKEAGLIVYKTHKYVEQYIKPGITTNKLDMLANNYIKQMNAYPSFKDYNGFPKSICISVNEQVVHGIPNNYILKDGDIVSIDIGVYYSGYHADSAYTYGVGNINKDKAYLLEHSEKALYKGLDMVKSGNRIGDISNAIEEYANKYKLGVIKELVGHGIGKELHEEPNIPNYGIRGTGEVLKEGMTLAIEPMLVLGNPGVYIESDGYTISTKDKSPAAHFEHTVVVTKEGYKILTEE